MKLFAVYVGGSVAGAHLELHDMRFVAGERIEECYDALRAQWWGVPKSLHLDAWGPVEWADGFDISVEPVSEGTAGTGTGPGRQLYLVHLGGYDPGQFTELHENFFVVADSPQGAKKRALVRIDDWHSPHRDAVLELDDVIDIADALDGPAGGAGAELTVRLTPNANEKPFQFETGYRPIGRIDPA